MKTLFLALLLAASSAMADPTASNGTNFVTIHEAPCMLPMVLLNVPKEIQDKLHSAEASIGGELYKACWLLEGPVVHLVYEDGDEGLVPVTEFKNQPSL